MVGSTGGRKGGGSGGGIAGGRWGDESSEGGGAVMEVNDAAEETDGSGRRMRRVISVVLDAET